MKINVNSMKWTVISLLSLTVTAAYADPAIQCTREGNMVSCPMEGSTIRINAVNVWNDGLPANQQLLFTADQFTITPAQVRQARARGGMHPAYEMYAVPRLEQRENALRATGTRTNVLVPKSIGLLARDGSPPAIGFQNQVDIAFQAAFDDDRTMIPGSNLEETDHKITIYSHLSFAIYDDKLRDQHGRAYRAINFRRCRLYLDTLELNVEYKGDVPLGIGW